MEISEEILGDPDLLGAWTQGSQRILFDEDRAVGERVDAGCALVYLATREEGQVPAWGAVPAGLPTGLVASWESAFSGVDEHERLAAVVEVYEGLSRGRLADQGAEILRRELGEVTAPPE